ncbi:nuclear transport factor 2 family protein [Tardiphaga sp. P5_C10]
MIDTAARTKVIADIKELEERRRVAMLAADVATLDKLFAEQMVYTHSNAATDNKAEYLDKLGERHFDYRKLAFLDQEIRLAGDAALVTGRMTGEVVIAGALRKLNGQTTVVWIKQDARWQLLAFQSTPIPAV